MVKAQGSGNGAFVLLGINSQAGYSTFITSITTRKPHSHPKTLRYGVCHPWHSPQ